MCFFYIVSQFGYLVNTEGCDTMPVYKAKNPTKDGRAWFYKVNYRDAFNNIKTTVSKKYMTRTEAKDGERIFLNEITLKNKPNGMTMGELFKSFLEYKKDKIKITTYMEYESTIKYLDSLVNVKCNKLTIKQVEAWKQDMNGRNLTLATKQRAFSLLASLINYAIKWHQIDMTLVSKQLENFSDPNVKKKEMDFYTYEEFQKFIAVEEDLRFRCIFEIAYYCGLRMGELRALTWDNIDLKERTITINKQIPSGPNKNIITTPKNSFSYRTIPMCEVLYNDIKALYDERSQYSNFELSWYVLGENGVQPPARQIIGQRKRVNAKIAGVKVIRMHDFRHSCASLLINSGAKIPLVSRYLGHSRPTTTLNVYSHMFKDDLDTLVSIIDEKNSD